MFWRTYCELQRLSFIKKILITSLKISHPKITPPEPSIVPLKILPVTDMPPSAHTRYKRKYRAKTYAEATVGNSNNLITEPISNIVSQFVSQLNSLITPIMPKIPYLLKFVFVKLNNMYIDFHIYNFYIFNSQ